jgi:predicted nucleotide-binding protein
VQYAAPPPLIIEATNPRGAITGSTWAATGARASGTEASAEPIKQEAAPAAPQITIQVQAMDSRSFLDHSGDIARAVREAMLNMHSLNDVINDL